MVVLLRVSLSKMLRWTFYQTHCHTVRLVNITFTLIERLKTTQLILRLYWHYRHFQWKKILKQLFLPQIKSLDGGRSSPFSRTDQSSSYTSGSSACNDFTAQIPPTLDMDDGSWIGMSVFPHWIHVSCRALPGVGLFLYVNIYIIFFKES